MKALVLAWLAYEFLLKPKPAPRGTGELGEITVGSSPNEWANPYRGVHGETADYWDNWKPGDPIP